MLYQVCAVSVDDKGKMTFTPDEDGEDKGMELVIADSPKLAEQKYLLENAEELKEVDGLKILVQQFPVS